MNVIARVLLLVMLQYVAYSFKNNAFRSSAIRTNPMFAVSTTGKAEWAADDEGPAGFRDLASQRKLNSTFVNNLVGARRHLFSNQLQYES